MTLPSTMDAPISVGFFQTHELLGNGSIRIRDQLYGDHVITEPVLVDLLQCPDFQRLKGICHHGISSFLGFVPRVTRLEHSVGAFMLVRQVGGSLEEQIAALLHDVSHTTLSHVIDHALSKPGEESYHEVHKARYLRTTRLPEILQRYGINRQVFQEEEYPLVEKASPQLCADRLDNCLRDTAAFDKLDLQDARRLFLSLQAFPTADSPYRLLVLNDPHLALTLCRAHIAADRDVISNRAHIDLYKKTGRIIADSIDQGLIKEEVLWTLSDEQFWASLRQTATPDILRAIEQLETGGLPDEEGLRIPKFTKIRTIDPDIWGKEQTEPAPLSTVLPEWKAERQEYLLSRAEHRE